LAVPKCAQVLFPIVLLILISNPGRAQVLYGSITGNVTDPSGAAVPGATVQVQTADTGLKRDVKTNEAGVYLISDLPPGNYTITINSPAFASLVLNGASVTANQVRRADAALQVAQVSQTVEVSTASAPLQTDRADVNTNITNKEVANLPITGSGGRNFQSLMVIVPGTTVGGPQNSAAADPGRSFSINVNGVSRLQNNTRIDGSSITYPWLPTNIVYQPPAEAIENVNVVTNAFNAEQGLAGGAEVNVTVKSGTNEVPRRWLDLQHRQSFLCTELFPPYPAKQQKHSEPIRFGTGRSSLDSKGLQRKKQAILFRRLGAHHNTHWITAEISDHSHGGPASGQLWGNWDNNLRSNFKS